MSSLPSLRVLPVVLLGLIACSKAKQPEPPASPTKARRDAATAAPTLTTIAVDGQFADWQQVMLNPLQVTVDGNGSISGAGCYPTNPDRDCELFTPQRDIGRFAWTFDAANIYTSLERPTSNATLTYSFVMDVDADGVAEPSDRVLQVDWKTGGRALGVKLFAYVPAVAGGDPLACPDAASCPSVVNPQAQVGFVDGYNMPGTTGVQLWSPPAPAPACVGSGAGDQCGGDGIGTRFEVFVPWSQLGVPTGSPIFWHVASSTNTQFNQAKDNVGGPDGKLGTFGVFGMDFTPDRNGFSTSPGAADYCHEITNTGNFPDAYNLSAISSTSSSITFFTDTGGCVAGAQLGLDANGDGDFTDPGDSVNPAFDSDADARPNTPAIAANAVFRVVIRLTVPAGLDGSTDQLIATARSIARPALVFDKVTDRTKIGPVTVTPELALTGTPGVSVDFGPHTIRNNQSFADTFNYFVRSSHGYSIALYADSGGAPGAFIALDSNGDGSWDGATPTTGPLASGGTRLNWIRVTIPAGAPIGTVDVITLTLTSTTTPTVIGAAQDTLTVLDGLTIGPSYTAPSSQLFGPAGTSVYLPHFVINSLQTSNTVSLSQTGTLAAGYTLRWWTDPNGDGSIADGVLITAPFTLGPSGGTANLVTEVVIPLTGTPAFTAAVTTVTGPATTASADDHVAVGSLQTYLDPLLTQPSRYFPACSTIYAKALTPPPFSQTTNYQLRYTNPAGATISNANLPTDGVGEGRGSYTLLAADPPGNWRVRIFAGAIQIYDLDPVVVERSGAVTASGPAAAIGGQPLAVSALLLNTALQSDYPGTSVTFVVRDPSNAVLQSTTVTAIDVGAGGSATAFGAWPNVSYPAYGNYTVTASWNTSCGSLIATGTTVVPYFAPAPVLLTPADNAFVNTATPALTGTAEPGATVNVSINGVLSGSVVAGATGAFSFPAPAQSAGVHPWSATQTVNGLTGPASASFAFTVDLAAPAAPVLIAPADGSFTNLATPTYSGSAEPGSTVRVSVDGVLACTTTASAAGAFSCSQPGALTAGSHAVNATATDAATNTSGPSNTNNFTVDLTAPAAPVLIAPADGSASNDSTPAYSGTAEAGSTVRVSVDGVLACTTLAGASGAFGCVQPIALAAGPHLVNATATDAASNPSAVSNTNSFTLDFTAPAAPVLIAPANGSFTNDPTPDYSGTAEAGSLVQVSVDGVLTCSAVATAAGTFGCTQPGALLPGPHTVTAIATDPANNGSGVSNANSFTVDTTPPVAPIVTAPASGSSTNDSTPAYSGTAEPGSTVSVVVDGSPVCTSAVSAAGTWSCTPATPLTDGSHTVSATATDAANNPSPPSGTSTFTVDSAPPAAPVVTAPADGSSTNDSTPGYSGTAEAGSTVTVSVDGSPACTAIAGAAGAFSCTPAAVLAGGSHTVSATATDGANNTSAASATNTFTVDLAPPAAPVVAAPADGAVVSDPTPDYSGTAEPSSTVTVSVDGSPVCTVTASAAGAWTCTPAAPLADGSHAVSATATDAATNVSPASPANTFTVDSGAPAAPVVTAPANGSSTNDSTPAYTGTAEASSTVIVSVDGSPVCTVSASAAGAWSCTPATALAGGSHSVTATATDAANNTSPASAANNFTVDLVAPAAPVVLGPASGSVGNDPTPEYSGTAEPDSTVTVSVDGSPVCTVTASAAGTWSCTPTAALAEGTHSVEATAADAATNTSAPSAAHSFTLDLTAPAAPVVSAPADGAVTGNNLPSYSGTAEAGSTVTVRVDGAVSCTALATAAGTFSCAQPTALADGAHQVNATAADPAGNLSPVSASNTFTVDATAPAAPALTAPANNSATNDPLPGYSGSAEAGSTVTVTVDGVVVCTATASAAGTFSCTQPAALAEGPHQASATATDPAGNASAASATVTFTVDTTPPDTSIVTGPPAQDPATTASFDFSSSEPGSSFECSLDSAAFVPCSDPAMFSLLAVGTHTLRVRATDAAGNTDPSPAQQTWEVLPQLDTTIVSGPPALTRIAAAQFDFSSNTANVSYECSLDGSTFAPCTDPASFTGLPDGPHSLRVRAKDSGGQLDPSPAQHLWTLDTLAPNAPVITAPSNGSTVGINPPAITGTAEPGTTVTVLLDGVEAGTAVVDSFGTWSFTPAAALSGGSHTATARATDPAGNTGPTSQPSTFTVDPDVLDTAIVSGPSGITNSQSAAFGFSSNKTGVSYECSLDGGAFAACANPATFSGLSEGPHTLRVRARDGLGNTDASPASRVWRVDSVAPPAPVVSAPANGATVGTATPNVIGTAEAGSTVTVVIDGVVAGTAPVDAGGNWSFATTAPLGAGPHTGAARATDPAGNVSPDSAVNTFTVDLTALDTFIVSGPLAISRFDSAVFDLASNQPNVTYQCSLDGAAFAACTDPADFTGLSDGDHTLRARALDSAGLADPTPASFSWRIDTQAPAAPVITSPANGATLIDNRPVITGTAEPGAVVRVSIDNQLIGWATADSSGNWSLPASAALADGTHIVSAAATDAVGNPSLVSATHTFTVVTAVLAAPTITAPADGTLTNDATPTVSGQAPPGSTVSVFVDGVLAGTAVADANGDWSLTLPVQPDGARALTAQATRGPQQSAVSAPTTLVIDTTPPEVRIVEAPPPRNLEPAARFEFGTNDPAAVYECSLDGAAFAPCSEQYRLTSVPEGEHSLSVRAVDAAGNRSAAKSVSWIQASAPPPKPPEQRLIGGGCSCASVDPAALLGLLGLLAAIRRRAKR